MQDVAKLLQTTGKLLSFIVARKLGYIVARDVLIRCQLAEGWVGSERFRVLRPGYKHRLGPTRVHHALLFACREDLHVVEMLLGLELWIARL